MRNTARLLFLALAAVGILAACTDHRTTASAPYVGNDGVIATAPNPNNPYASDPLDPDMNPHYMRNPRGGVH